MSSTAHHSHEEKVEIGRFQKSQNRSTSSTSMPIINVIQTYSVDTTLPRPLGNRRMKPLPGLSTSRIHPPPKIKPRVLLFLGLVLRPAPIIATQDARIDESHGPHGVGAKRDASTDLGECGRGLVDVYAEVRVAEEADGQGKATDPTTANGD
jgi:hypothetical protein